MSNVYQNLYKFPTKCFCFHNLYKKSFKQFRWKYVAKSPPYPGVVLIPFSTSLCVIPSGLIQTTLFNEVAMCSILR